MSGLIIMRNPGESEEDFNKRAREVVRQKTEGLQYNVSELKEIIQDEHISEIPAFFIEKLDEPSFLEDFNYYIKMWKVYETHLGLKQWKECLHIIEMLEDKLPYGAYYFDHFVYEIEIKQEREKETVSVTGEIKTAEEVMKEVKPPKMELASKSETKTRYVPLPNDYFC